MRSSPDAADDLTRSDTALIFDIQRFSLHDGPGIRTTLFFKGCPLRCSWCQNPESRRRHPEVAFYAERCQACFTCRAACGKDAILSAQDRRIAYQACNHCGACTRVCPTKALVTIGTPWGAKALLAEALKDQDFFLDSRGGITLSGGEPMVHWQFLRQFLPLVKARGIHVNMETSGFFALEQIESLRPHLDLIYFDLKHMDSQAHHRHTGVGNQRILDNFARLAGEFKHLQPRMPVVPSINDDAVNIRATAACLHRSGLTEIHLLPYHNLGESKGGRIKGSQATFAHPSLEPLALTPIQKLFAEEGIHADIVS